MNEHLEDKPELKKCMHCFKYADPIGKYFMKGEWFTPADIEATNELFRIEMGYCNPCYNKMLKELDDLEKRIIKSSGDVR